MFFFSRIWVNKFHVESLISFLFESLFTTFDRAQIWHFICMDAQMRMQLGYASEHLHATSVLSLWLWVAWIKFNKLFTWGKQWILLVTKAFLFDHVIEDRERIWKVYLCSLSIMSNLAASPLDLLLNSWAMALK